MEKIWAIIVVSCLGYHAGLSQALDFTAIRAEVDFSRTLQEWDGFGFNYVETAHSADMEKFNQEYGGFSLLDDKEKREIIEMVFGEDGLKVGLIKMFLGSLHQTEAGGPFDHKYTTENMRFFVREGLKTTRSRGGDFKIITTLYGPPGYTTKQKVHRGRDLDLNLMILMKNTFHWEFSWWKMEPLSWMPPPDPLPLFLQSNIYRNKSNRHERT